MFAAPRGLQMILSLFFTTLLPVVTTIVAIVFYTRTGWVKTSPLTRSAGTVLFLLAFFTTTSFWILSLWAIEYHTPIGDTGGMLFMVTLMVAGFVYWWPGLAVTRGRSPGHEGNLDRAACLKRIIVGAAGGLLGGLPIYLLIHHQRWHHWVLVPD